MFQAHVRVYLVKTFLAVVQDAREPTVRRVLRQLAQLFVYDAIVSSSSAFLEVGFYDFHPSRTQVQLLSRLKLRRMSPNVFTVGT